METKISGIPIGQILAERQGYLFFKRIFDLFFSTVGILCVLPLGILVALCVKLGDGGPVFFRQIRVGQGGKPFGILKFRTMVMGAEKLGPAVTKDRDPRITRVGRFLRKTKLDELPQLWNVLAGQMSFVGPRPEVPKYVDRYTPEQRQLLELKPGITDLATLMFRDEESLLKNAVDVEAFYMSQCVPRKFALNMEYVRRASLFEDVWLIGQTLCPYWVVVAAGYSVFFTLSLLLAYWLRFEFSIPANEWLSLWKVAPAVVFIQLGMLVKGRQLSGLLTFFDAAEMRELGKTLLQAAGLQILVWYASHGEWMPGRGVILIQCVVAFFLLSGIRVQLRSWREHRSRVTVSNSEPMPVAIVGAGEVGAWLARQLNQNKARDRQVVAFFDDDPKNWNMRLCNVPVVGMPECATHEAWKGRLREVIVAMPEATPERVAELCSLYAKADMRTRVVPSIDQMLGL